MRDMRRMRINVLATALGLIIPILILTAVAGIRMLILLPVVMSFWFLFYMPRWRRRVRLQARNLQKWQLHPEYPPTSNPFISMKRAPAPVRPRT